MRTRLPSRRRSPRAPGLPGHCRSLLPVVARVVVWARGHLRFPVPRGKSGGALPIVLSREWLTAVGIKISWAPPSIARWGRHNQVWWAPSTRGKPPAGSGPQSRPAVSQNNKYFQVREFRARKSRRVLGALLLAHRRNGLLRYGVFLCRKNAKSLPPNSPFEKGREITTAKTQRDSPCAQGLSLNGSCYSYFTSKP
jgi:hypothetical protein